MYYFIRIVLVLAVYALIFFALVKSKKLVFFTKKRNPELYEKMHTDKRFKRGVYITYFFLIVLFIAIAFLAKYPYEGYFITFDSINDSLAYKNISTENIDTYDYDDCVFVVDNSEYKIYSLTKINGQYKLVDFNSEDNKFIQLVEKGNMGTTEPRIAKYNKETNKTFYYFGITGKEKPEDGKVTLDGNEMQYCRNAKSKHFIQSLSWDYWIYSFLDNAAPKAELTVDSGTCKVVLVSRSQNFFWKAEEDKSIYFEQYAD